MGTVLVRGTGDVGSAVAYALFRAGHAVVLHDQPRPPHHRRGMAFVDALYAGVVDLQGVIGKKARTLDDLPHMRRCGRAVPVSDAPFDKVIAMVCPDVLVDARMRKRAHPESQRGLAPLTIGLGPNFEAGVNADAVVETAWGDELGAVLWSGRTRTSQANPRKLRAMRGRATCMRRMPGFLRQGSTWVMRSNAGRKSRASTGCRYMHPFPAACVASPMMERASTREQKSLRSILGESQRQCMASANVRDASPRAY